MKVYVVTYHSPYGDAEDTHVFATRESAKKYIQKKYDSFDYKITECEVES